MATNTGHEVTSEDIRKIEAQEAKYHGGSAPSLEEGGEAALLKSQLSNQESKAEQIDRVKANLPLPDMPVGGASASLESADARTVNAGSGGVNAKLGTDDALRGPSTAESGARVDGDVVKKDTVAGVEKKGV